MTELNKILKIDINLKSARKEAVLKLKEMEKFFDNFAFLVDGQDFVLLKGHFITYAKIIKSACITLESVIDCVKKLRIADANILLRKFRDDIFFFLYVVYYNINDKGNDEIKEKINNWRENKLKNLRWNKVLDFVESDYPKIVEKYHLRPMLNNVSKKLNDFVHGHGKDCYNKIPIQYLDNELIIFLEELVKNSEYITIVFLFILFLIAPNMVRSTSYVDCLELQMVPEEDMLFEIAPFIEKYIIKHANIIDDSIISYLRENTRMHFN